MRRAVLWIAVVLLSVVVGGVGGYVVNDALEKKPELTDAERFWCPQSRNNPDPGDPLRWAEEMRRWLEIVQAMSSYDDGAKSEIDALTDVFRIGVLAAESVTGRTERDRFAEVVRQWALDHPELYVRACKAVYEVEVNT